MTEQLFEWDENKAASNYRKHGIKFENAVHVFDDPLRILRQDRIENGEYRWQVLGMTQGEQLLLVAHTYRNRKGLEVVRIISARKATKQERNEYGNRAI